jgi:formiminoglutamase
VVKALVSEKPSSENRSWRSIADLMSPALARIALLGAPLSEKSLTPGRCDLAPKVVRETLRRFSVYDVESGGDLGALRIRDCGDVPLKTRTPEEALTPLVEAARDAYGADLALIIGGNNAITRPGARALGDLSRVGLLTLDAHFDLRDTDGGLNNGNPVRALIEDGLPGKNIVQIGLAPFANTARMNEFARSNGVEVRTLADCFEQGVVKLVDRALTRLSKNCDAVYVDFDIDVIDRAQCPGAPGARPGGLPARDFFAAARAAAAFPKVKAVDLTEFDPSLDVSDVTALTAGRWVCEILSGFAARSARFAGKAGRKA